MFSYGSRFDFGYCWSEVNRMCYSLYQNRITVKERDLGYLIAYKFNKCF